MQCYLRPPSLLLFRSRFFFHPVEDPSRRRSVLLDYLLRCADLFTTGLFGPLLVGQPCLSSPLVDVRWCLVTLSLSSLTCGYFLFSYGWFRSGFARVNALKLGCFYPVDSYPPLMSVFRAPVFCKACPAGHNGISLFFPVCRFLQSENRIVSRGPIGALEGSRRTQPWHFFYDGALNTPPPMFFGSFLLV